MGKPVKLEKTSTIIKAFGDSIVRPIGKIKLTILRDGKCREIKFEVVSQNHPPLLSSHDSQKLGFIKICQTLSINGDEGAKQILNLYKDVFNGIGKVSKEVSLEIDKALKRVNYQMPTIEEVMPELKDAKVFTTLDANKGFWQISLDHASSELTTFWTPFGRYRWKRLPFGISPAPELYQKMQHEVLEGLEGVECLCDDILGYGCGDTEELAMLDHNRKLRNLLERLRQKNLKLNGAKTKLCRTEVRFFGHMLTNQGVKADPAKIVAISDMREPRNIKETQTFVGMANYLSKFLLNLSTLAEPLRRICKENVKFDWSTEQQHAFDKIKGLVTQAPILQYFDSEKPIVIQCDASATGLGGVLLQNGRPVAFASRTLNSTEQNYAQIEKESLAILFSCARFEQYILGKPVTVESDHRPLQKIIKKLLLTIPKRLQRMFLALQRYNISLVFVPGSKMFIADMLSRLHLRDDVGVNIECVYCLKKFDNGWAKWIQNINLIEDLPISDERIQSILNETLRDGDMKILTGYILHGFPENNSEVPIGIRPFQKYREELTTQNGLIFKGNRLVIPKGLRGEMLKRLHYSHNGIENSTKLARDTMFWPNITDQLKSEVSTCEVCQINAPMNQQREPMRSSEILLVPFEYVSMDVCEVSTKTGKKINYLVMVDHYSDFIEVDELNNLEANTIIKCCKRNFSRHGIPKIVITDNGTHFKKDAFCNFAKQWEFKFATSSQRYPQSNGKAESAVRTIKQLMNKSKTGETDVYLALLNLRNTPNKVGSSPAQRLFSRRTRCLVPVVDKLLYPEVEVSVSEKIVDNKQRAKHYYDSGAKNRNKLLVGEPVFVRLEGASSKGPWHSGRISDRFSDRSFMVEVNNKQYRRNKADVKPNNCKSKTGLEQVRCRKNLMKTSTSDAPNIFYKSLDRDQEIGLLEVPIQNNQNESVENTIENDLPSSIVDESDQILNSSCSNALNQNGANSLDQMVRPKRIIKIPARLKDYELN